MLERLGYQAKSETNPNKALEIFASNPEQFDLIITDTTMPGMTGDRLIMEIIMIRADMKTTLCTGFVMTPSAPCKTEAETYLHLLLLALHNGYALQITSNVDKSF